MAKNSSLHAAKDAKNDEFYTELTEIQAEISNYVDKFKDKVVFCNCDDPFESNFVKYFLMNFNRLGLKELIATGYKTSTVGGTEIGEKNTPYALRVTDTSKYLVGTQKDLDIRGAKYFLETEGDKVMTPLIGNWALDEKGEQIQITVKEHVLGDDGKAVLDKKGKPKTKSVKRDLYYEAGDFRSDMSIALLKEATIVVTNPPFSLFREYVAQLIKYNKSFIILGNNNAITYKEIFSLFKNNQMWLGALSWNKELFFNVSKEYEDYLRKNKKEGSAYRIINGKFKARAAVMWYTNIDIPKRHQVLPLDLGYTYAGHEDMYPKYDNYDAINVDKVGQIPCDYMGCIGVPISFLDKYCPEQFEIIALGIVGSCDFTKNVEMYILDKKGKETNKTTWNAKGTLYRKHLDTDTKAAAFKDIKTGELYQSIYARILIKFTDDYINAHPEQFSNGDVE